MTGTLRPDDERERRVPDTARWAAVLVLGLAGIAGVLRAWTSAPATLLDPPRRAPAAREVAADSAPTSEASPDPRPVTSEPSRAPASVGRRINVNGASAAELDLLPGIGPALAGRIITDREANGPYRTLDDLDRVSGIGPKTIAKLAPYATVE